MESESKGSGQSTCQVIRPGVAYEGKQGPSCAAGVSAESVGAKAIWMGTVTIGPGGRTHAHFHEHHETAIFVLTGEVDMWSGPNLSGHEVARAGDHIYVPAGVTHVAVNRSQAEPATAVVARTDPNEQESVVLQPELDRLVPGGD
jgi:uncharacterized RmlC-like cupin family protein